MKRKLLLFVLTPILLVSMMFCLSGCKQKDEKTVEGEDVIKIGVILPLTGDQAQWGIPPKNALEIAVDEINSTGGINGKKIELIIEDDKCDSKEGVSALTKLINQHNTKVVIGAVCSSVTLALAPICEKNNIILISPASTNPQISESGDHIFRVIPSDELRGKAFAGYLLSLGYSKGALLYINNDGGKGNATSFSKYFEKDGGDIVLSESYLVNALDVRTQLEKLKKSDADFITIVPYLKDAVIVLKNLREMNIQIPFYFQSEALDDPIVIQNSGNAINGAIYISYDRSENERNAHFRKLYIDKYNKSPELYAAEAYDALHLVFNALSQKEYSVKDYLYSLNSYDGASGKFSFDSNGDVLKPFAIKRIENGNSTIIEVVD